MARRKKNPKDWSVFFLVVVPILALAAAGFAVTKGISYYLVSSDYFRVREVTAQGIGDDRYVQMIRDELAGANIFKVDVVNLAQRIRHKFPTFYEVRVRRILPSELRIIAEERIPVAVVYKDRYYVFDADGVALAAVASSDAVGLPLVEGVADHLPKIRTGFRYGLSGLRKALALALEVKRHADDLARLVPTGGQRVSKIVVAASGQLSFLLGDGPEVKVRDSRFAEQLDLLPAIVRNLGADIAQVTYLDLRPREPVIGMKSGGTRR